MENGRVEKSTGKHVVFEKGFKIRRFSQVWTNGQGP